MSVSENYLLYVQDQLQTLGPIRIKKMFGAVGIYFEDLIFACIDDDVLYFKADQDTCKHYEELGMPQFAPYMKATDKLFPMPYWQVHEDILSDTDRLIEWAHIAIQVSAATQKNKKKPSAKKGKAS